LQPSAGCRSKRFESERDLFSGLKQVLGFILTISKAIFGLLANKYGRKQILN